MSASAQSRALREAATYSAERRGVSLFVLQRGQMVFEDYPNGGGPQRGWELASGTKSFSGVMAAAAGQDGLLTLDERAADTLPEWRGDSAKRRITIRHLLSLTSGIEGGRLGRPPTYAEAVAAPATAEPGARFSYGPLPFQIFGEIMRRKTGGDPLDYLTRRILTPLNIRPTRWRRGVDGNPHLPSGAQLTARDWATFGAFVLRGGDGHVDAEVLRENFEPSRANPGYGLTWWLLRDGLIPPRPGAGVDVSGALAARFGEISMAAGAGDQRLYLVPDLQLVIVRQASGILRAMREARRGGGNAWSDDDFLQIVLNA
ncbi:MAG: serine hydrolase [Hyphomonadaceae bacterium]|nr:serine hydrolase [Hyphomonadaceae bacterium]